jgi:site-specific DNA-methyltransferase (adenine-specific)
MSFQIINDDALRVMDEYIRDGVKFDLLLTDPPYRTITGGDSNGANSERPKGMLRGNRKLFTHQNNIKPSDWMKLVYDCLKEGSHAYIFTNVLNLADMMAEAQRAGFKLHNLLVWEKNNCTPSQFYMKNCEYILFLRKGKAKWINDIGGSKTVHQFNNIIGNKQHPCEKPVDLLEFYIRNSSQEGDVVFDPFVGSGSSGLAAVKSGRAFVGIELDATYCAIANQRIQDIVCHYA